MPRPFHHLLLAAATLAAASAPAGEPVISRSKADGYRGIWFTLGQFYPPGTDGAAYGPASKQPRFPYGDKYSGGLGTYTCKHLPLAIYRPEVARTFFVFGGTPAADQRRLLCMAAWYDHKTHRVPRPTIVHDKQGVDDPHDNPSLAIDAAGHLWVFVSGRGRHRPGFKYRSTEPYSTDAFERITEEEFTYPQPRFMPGKGFLHLFTKYTGVRELYFETSPDGIRWSPDRKLAAIRAPGERAGGHYQTSEAWKNTKVGTFFNRHPQGNPDRRTDIYYLETHDLGRTWTTITGSAADLPLTTVDHPAQAVDYAARGLNVYLRDMGFDELGRPALLHVTSPGHQPGPPNSPRHLRLTRWHDNSWHTTTICEVDHNYDMGSLFTGPDTWLVVAPTLPGPQPHHAGGDLARWISRDHGTTWQPDRPLTSNSPRNHNYARRPVNAHDPFHVFWADGDPTRLSPSHLHFADSTGRHVFRLPYTMTGPTAEPERLTPLSGAAPEAARKH